MARNLTFSISFQGGKESTQHLFNLETELRRITAGYRKLQKEINKPSNANSNNLAQMKKDAAESRQKMHDLQTQVKETKKELSKQYKDSIADGNAVGSVAKLERKYAELKEQYMSLGRATRNSKVGKDMAKEARDVKNEIDKAHASINNYKNNIGNYPKFGQGLLDGSGIGRYMGSGGALALGATIAGAAVAGIAATAKEIYAINKEIDTIQGAVMKTTGLTNNEVERLTENLKKVDSVVSTSDLLRIAEEAGRFGVSGAKGVEAFTKSINLLSIGLGDEFKGDVGEITTTVAQLSNVMYGSTQNGELMAQRYLAIGNVLNGLANSGAATADGIANVAQRMASTLKPLGFLQEEIFGISSALLESGVNVERGATAFTRVNGILRKNYEIVANTLDIPVADFKKMLDTQPVEAFNTVVKKTMDLAGGSGTNLIKILRTMGINSEYAKEVFNAWGNNQQLFNLRIAESKELIGSTNTLLRDQATLTNTVTGQWNRLKNGLADISTNSGIQDWFKNILKSLADTTKLLSNGEFKAARTQAFWGDSSVMSGFGLWGMPKYARKRIDNANHNIQLSELGSTDQREFNPVYTGRGFGQQGLVYKDPYSFNAWQKYNKSMRDYIEDNIRTLGALPPEYNPSDYRGGGAGKGGSTVDNGAIGSLKYLQYQLQQLEDKINKADPDSPLFSSWIQQAERLRKEIKGAEFNIDLIGKGGKPLQNGVPIPDDFLQVDTGNEPKWVAEGEKERTKRNEQAKKDREKAAKEAKELQDKIDKNNLERQENLEKEKERTKQANYEAKEKRIRDKNAPLLSAERLFPDASEAELENIDEIKDTSLSAAKDITDSIFDYKEAMREENLKRELSALDREYNAKKIAAEGNATLQEAIELERVEKEQKLRKAAFEKEKKAKIAQAIASAALAIIQSFAQLGPIAGAIAAVATGITTGLQIAAIRNATFAKGGFTGNGLYKDHTGKKVAGIVHENEYVVNEQQVDKFRPIIDAMEQDRVSTMRGFVNGGYTSDSTYTKTPEYITSQYSRNEAKESYNIELIGLIAAAVERGSYSGTQHGSQIGQMETLRLKDRLARQQKSF